MNRRALVGAIAALAIVLAGAAFLATGGPALVPWDELDARWGSYLSEREWGTPREARGADPWGLDYLGAIRQPYAHGEDGIAGLVDRGGTFHLGWAVWNEEQIRVAERLFGWGNPSGKHGEEIVDRRTFGLNTPTTSIAESTLVYPNSDPQFRIVFGQARVDDQGGVLLATVDRNVASEPDAVPVTTGELPLNVVLKGWFHDPDLHVEAIEDGLLLHGPDSVVAIIGPEPDSIQVSAEKRALDENLRAGGLRTEPVGHIGALAYGVSVAAEGVERIGLSWAESDDPASAEARARELLPHVERVVDARRDEAEALFADDVSDHEPVYRQALMSLLWSQSLYRWDGASSWIPEWKSRVDAHDVLIMPDKWEFPGLPPGTPRSTPSRRRSSIRRWGPTSWHSSCRSAGSSPTATSRAPSS